MSAIVKDHTEFSHSRGPSSARVVPPDLVLALLRIGAYSTPQRAHYVRLIRMVNPSWVK
jgi:hypothetical protein